MEVLKLLQVFDVRVILECGNNGEHLVNIIFGVGPFDLVWRFGLVDTGVASKHRETWLDFGALGLISLMEGDSALIVAVLLSDDCRVDVFAGRLQFAVRYRS